MAHEGVDYAGLTQRQAAFVKAFVSSGIPNAAAKAAGYSSGLSGYSALGVPAVVNAIYKETQRQLIAEDAPASIRTLRRIRDDENAPAKVRADISIKMLHMAGHVAPRSNSVAEGKQLSEMSTDELRKFIADNEAEIHRLEREIADRATAVDAQVNAQADPKPLSYLD